MPQRSTPLLPRILGCGNSFLKKLLGAINGAAHIGAPEHLTSAHNLDEFHSGTPELDDWLKRRALANEGLGASRTYVVIEGERVVGFYALATGAVAHKDVSAKARRNMSDPIPVMVLARLAVDVAYQNGGVGHLCCEMRFFAF